MLLGDIDPVETTHARFVSNTTTGQPPTLTQLPREQFDVKRKYNGNLETLRGLACSEFVETTVVC